METVVYILYSRKHGKRYVGCTTDLIARFKSHQYLGTKGWTVKFRPWEVVHVEFYGSKSEALRREQFLKSGRGRSWIERHIDFSG